LNRLVDHAAYRSDYQRALTGIRGVAALWVLLYHAWVYSTPRLIQFELAGIQFDITPLFSTGFVGVDLFFVLSAYLLGTRYFRWIEGRAPRPVLQQYFMRRVARVYPAYLLQLFLLLLLAATTSLYTMPGGAALLAHLFFYFNLPPPLDQSTERCVVDIANRVLFLSFTAITDTAAPGTSHPVAHRGRYWRGDRLSLLGIRAFS
jgi:peptidoglycan/LPS O-acetylase OafA/YrhL